MQLFQFHDVFNEIVALLLLAVAVGAVALRLRQPVLVGFILVGILVGPSGLGAVRSTDQIHLLAEMGLALLLFVVGLKLDVGHIRSAGVATLVAGVGQVVLTAAFGYLLVIALGLSGVAAFYVAVSLTFSSTIIVIKLLSDKRDTDSLYGRLSIGILIVQDIVVVFAMIALSGLSKGGDFGRQSLMMLIKGGALLAGLSLFSAWPLPRILGLASRSRELLVLFAIAWAVGLADLTKTLGFSIEVGAFLAGVTLASTGYRESIAARLVSLRDFLLVFFFIELGAGLDLRGIGSTAWIALPISLFVVIVKPVMVMSVLGAMGYRKRVGFLAGLSLGQISEFSLILAGLGLKLGHIDASVFGIVTLVGLITIGVSSYLISYSNLIYERVAPYLKMFERKMPYRAEINASDCSPAVRPEVILYGLGRYGNNVAAHLRAQNRSVLGIDFDPQAVRRWNKRGWSAVFGDAEDPEFPSVIPLAGARWVISSLRDVAGNLTLIDSLHHHGYEGGIAVTADDLSQASILRDAGAVVVFVPFLDSASQAVDILNDADEKEARRKMDKIISNLRDHYIVCGYGRMGRQIVEDFARAGVPYVVIEWNPEQLPKLMGSNTPFIEGKATEDEILIQAGIDRAKGVIAVTATDEENVYIVLSARGLNPGLYIVARSTRSENEAKLRRAGADRVMSPYTLGGHQIASAVLKPRVMDFLNMVLHSDELDLELGEVYVAESSEMAGRSIRDLRIGESAGALILSVRRADDGLHTTPSPDFEIRAWDHLIVIGTAVQIESVKKLAQAAEH
ncbi:MAG: cation:proton antiporter [Armatimonadota bacterium]|nr:cation:proton antiporter [bacterium]